MTDNIEQVELTILDTETTGLNPFSGDRIVELAALRVKGQLRIAQFEALVNPGREISPGAFAVNKITPEMLQAAPPMAKIMPDFLAFIQGSCLCSYNAEFDLNFLNQELKLLGYPQLTNFIVFDVLTMARKLIPGLARYTLWFVASELKVKLTQKHRAFSDVEMTQEVFNRLKIIGQQKGVSSFADFSRQFAFNAPCAKTRQL